MTNLSILLFQEPVVIVLVASVSKCCINQITVASFLVDGGRRQVILSQKFCIDIALHVLCLLEEKHFLVVQKLLS